MCQQVARATIEVNGSLFFLEEFSSKLHDMEEFKVVLSQALLREQEKEQQQLHALDMADLKEYAVSVGVDAQALESVIEHVPEPKKVFISMIAKKMNKTDQARHDTTQHATPRHAQHS